MYNILSFHRDFDTVDNPFANSCGRARALDKGDVIYLASLLDAQPKAYLDELQSQLALHHDVDVSLATISHMLCRLAVSNKNVSAAAAERNEPLRATWIA